MSKIYDNLCSLDKHLTGVSSPFFCFFQVGGGGGGLNSFNCHITADRAWTNPVFCSEGSAFCFISIRVPPLPLPPPPKPILLSPPPPMKVNPEDFFSKTVIFHMKLYTLQRSLEQNFTPTLLALFPKVIICYSRHECTNTTILTAKTSPCTFFVHSN